MIGAGPAGAFASYKLASAGPSVILVERSNFPRKKVCGSCLNHAAVTLLQEEGLDEILTENKAVPLQRFWLASGKSHAVLDMPQGSALSREVFDAGLVQKAVEKGANFFPETRIVLEKKATEKDPFHSLRIFKDQKEICIKAKIILSADGLNGQFLEKEKGFEMVTDPASRIGAGKIFNESPDFYQPGVIYMATGAEGYVGLVRLEDGRLNAAAAFDPEFLRTNEGVGEAVQKVLQKNQFPLMRGIEDPWQGTFPLSRKRRQVAAYKIFVIGDSAGYVEPFTGEGIALALASARDVTEFVVKGIENLNSDLEIRWQELYHKQMTQRQNRCRLVTRLLRNATLTSTAVRFLSWFPETASPFVEEITS